METRPATAEDIRRFHGSVPYNAVALAGMRDGEVIGVGGVYYADGRPVVFSGFQPGEVSKRDIVRGAKIIMDMIRGRRGPVYAMQDDNERAARTLAHFGFSPLSDGWWVRHE